MSCTCFRMIADWACSPDGSAFSLRQSGALSERSLAAAAPRFLEGLDAPDRVVAFELFQTVPRPPVPVVSPFETTQPKNCRVPLSPGTVQITGDRGILYLRDWHASSDRGSLPIKFNSVRGGNIRFPLQTS